MLVSHKPLTFSPDKGSLTGGELASQSKVLVFDIERARGTALVYDRQVRGGFLAPSWMDQKSFMVCYAAKWYGEEAVLADYLRTDKAIRARDESVIAEQLTQLVNEADAVIGHNVDRFDLTHLATIQAEYEGTPVKAVETIDTLTIARSLGGFFKGNSLRELLYQLEAPDEFLKGDPPVGWDRKMWRNKDILQEVTVYCKQDVRATEWLYNRLLPYRKG